MRWTGTSEAPAVVPPARVPAPAVEATAAALVALGATGEVRELPADLSGPAEVAAHLGVATAALARTTVLTTRDGRRLMVVSSRVHRLFPPALAAVLSEPELTVDDDLDVLRCTGAVLGSASPIGLAEPLPTFVDVALALHPVVWVPAGHPHTLFRTRYDELLRLTGGHPVEIG
ncbi:YbaK/EbsC family protein [Kineococcus sp. T13]|uniref:aminoacyl-tRNA deacylase n=1 Tax=Kineococcus vitellinus TaxID=2696565 RepID=UPI001412FE2B|nr:YbaK/EbsC family protein [Kineococcus vitellinus]NAZ75905.1 YbaK/EbsC family protein [Kineococcus vitellinus]